MNIKSEKAITLLTLVITVIILLILTGITLAALGENGLITKAKQAKIEQMKAEAKENIGVAVMQVQLNDTEQGKMTTLQDLHDKLPEKDDKITTNDYDESDTELTGKYKSDKNTEFDFIIDEDFNVIIEEISSTSPKFNIKIDEITISSLRMTGAVEELTGFGATKFTYVIQKITGDPIKYENIADPSYTITGLEQGTTYRVYMIAYDNEGNERISRTKTIKTETIPDQTTGAITFSKVTWANGKASVTISTASNYYIEYQINGTSGEWTKTSEGEKTVTLRDLNNGNVVYARLTDGIVSGEYAEVIISDTGRPTVTLNVNVSAKTEITATASATDSESGIFEDAIYTFYIKEQGKEYTQIQNTASKTCTFTNLKQNTQYTVKVEVSDKAGNKGVQEKTVQTGGMPDANQPGAITVSEVTWEDGKAKVTVTTGTEYKLEYQINGTEDGKWEEAPGDGKTVTITDLENGDTVYVRLTDGENAGEYKEIVIEDKQAPQVTLSTSGKTTSSIIATAEAIDNETGIAEDAIYTFYIKEANGEYVQKQNTTSKICEFTELKQNTEYTIKVEVQDKAGNVGYKETTITTGTMPDATKDGAIKVSEVTWENGKAQITISTDTEYKIEYQINATEEENWSDAPEDGKEITLTELENETIIYVRLTDGINVGQYATIQIVDAEKPNEFEITITDITYTEFTVLGSTTDGETGLKDYTYVAEPTKEGEPIIVEHITDEKYVFTNLQNGTEYRVYMIAYDNAGNERKSNEVTITTKNSIGSSDIEKAKDDSMFDKTGNTEIEDENGNPITIPEGFKIKDDPENVETVDKGIIIIDRDGNEFVWVPVGTIYTDKEHTEANTKTIELNRYTFDTKGNSKAQNDAAIDTYFKELETSTYGNATAKNISDFKQCVEKNSGFYIGRYEARTGTERTSTTDTITPITEKGTDSVYNYVTQIQAAELARNMYDDTKPFTSDLINSYAWDTATLFLQTCGTNAKYSIQPSINSTLAITGTNSQSTQDVQCNVYDMASNIYEWNTETYSLANRPCGRRGGVYDSTTTPNTRYGFSTSLSNDKYGFRPIIYIDQTPSNKLNYAPSGVVQYDAGEWTQEEIEELQNKSLYNVNVGKGASNTEGTKFTFGGFSYKGDTTNKIYINNETIVTSRNKSVTPQASTGIPKYEGWQILETIEKNGKTYVKKIVHAGSPENFVNYYGTSYDPHRAEYILSNGTRQTEYNTYQARNWDMYKDKTLDEKGYIEDVHVMRYDEAYKLTGDINATDALRNTGASYWLGSTYSENSAQNSWMVGLTGNIGTSRNYCLGVRPVVFLKPGVYIESGDGTEESPYILGKEESDDDYLKIEVSKPLIINDTNTTTEVADYTTVRGTKLKIKFTAMLEGTECTITNKDDGKTVPYEITNNGIYTFIVTGTYNGRTVTEEVNVDVKKYQEQGGFVQYDAGNWTQEEIEELQNKSLYDINTEKEVDKICKLNDPNGKNFTFGGFTYKEDTTNADAVDAGTIVTSRNQSVGTAYNNGEQPRDEGWMVLETIKENGKTYVTKLVHAGSPENFTFSLPTTSYPNASQKQYSNKAEYLLSGGQRQTSHNTVNGVEINPRNWDMYKDQKQLDLIDEVHMMTSEEAYTAVGDVPINTQGPSTSNILRNIGSHYFLATVDTFINGLACVYNSGTVDDVYAGCMGVRPVVTLVENVYIESGTGEKDDPYVLKKELNVEDEVKEGAITFSDLIWEDGKAKVIITTDTDYEIEHQENETDEDKWEKAPGDGKTVTIIDLENGDTVNVRLTDGENAGEHKEIVVQDTQAPTVTLTTSGNTTSSVTATADAIDNETGIAEDAIYTFYIKEADGEYKEIQSTTDKTCDFTELKQNTEYTIKVEVEDKAGNKGIQETTITTGTMPDATQNGAITFGEVTWENGKAQVTITTNTEYQIEYQVDETTEGSWIKGTKGSESEKVTGLNNNSILYARLTDGINAGQYATLQITDVVAPTVTLNTTINSTSKATATAEAEDNETGIAEDAIYTFYIKEANGEYRQIQNTTSKTCEFTRLKQNTSYTIKVEVEDKAGNIGSKEKVIQTSGVLDANQEGAIASEIIWEDGKAKVIITTDTDYEIEHQVNGTDEDKWVEAPGDGKTNEVTDLENEDKVYVRLTDGTNAGQYKEIVIRDNQEPEVTLTTSGKTTSSAIATAEAIDNETGIAEDAIYTFYIKEADGEYKKQQETTSKTCEFTELKQNTEYTIKVEVQDKAGNIGYKETTITTGTMPDATQNGAITFSEVTWNNGKAQVTITTNTEYQIEYQVDETTEGSWTKVPKENKSEEVTDLEHNSILYARLTDGTNAGQYATLEIIDAIEPTVELKTISNKTSEITVEANAIDNETGIAEDAVYTFYIKEVDGEYVQKQNTTSKTCEFTELKQNTEYTIKVEVEDKAGNKGYKETTLTTGTVPDANQDGAITSVITWEDGKAKVTVTTETGYEIEHQVNGTEETNWETTPGEGKEKEIIDLNNKDKVYVRLTDGTNAGQYKEIIIEDNQAPTITLNTIKNKPSEITVEANATDAETGIDENAIYTFYIKEPDGEYKQIQNTTSKTCDFTGLKQNVEYTVKVEVEDKAGNKGVQEKTITTGTIPDATKDGAIKVGNVTWENGKAQVTISTDTDYKIEYQIDGTDEGSWIEVPEDGKEITLTELENNTTIYARLTDGINAGQYATIEIVDVEKPKEFEITVTGIDYTEFTVAGSTTDGETGLKDYTYVLEPTAGGDPIKVEHVTEESHMFTDLTDDTEYRVYMLAYDNAGNERKSNEEIIKTKRYEIENEKIRIGISPDLQVPAIKYKGKEQITAVTINGEEVKFRIDGQGNYKFYKNVELDETYNVAVTMADGKVMKKEITVKPEEVEKEDVDIFENMNDLETTLEEFKFTYTPENCEYTSFQIGSMGGGHSSSNGTWGVTVQWDCADILSKISADELKVTFNGHATTENATSFCSTTITYEDGTEDTQQTPTFVNTSGYQTITVTLLKDKKISKIVFVMGGWDPISGGSSGYVNNIQFINAKLNYIDYNDDNEKTMEIPVSLSEGMVPVKYKSAEWYVCSKDDEEWYNYENKEYANIMLLDEITTENYTNEQIKEMNTREQLETLAGEKVTKEGSMFVWIPRYAYKITKGYHDGGTYNYTDAKGTSKTEVITGEVSVKFIDATDNYRDGSGKVTNYTTMTYADYVVHPAFNWGDTPLEGLWIAKYQASRNANETINITTNSGQVQIQRVKYAPLTNNNIYTNLSVDQCIKASEDLKSDYYGLKGDNVDSHLLKNTEWGVATYLAYSEYGTVPEIWNFGSDTRSIKNAISEKNTGIYDMNGSFWEFVAGYCAANETTQNDGNVTWRADLLAKPDVYKDYYTAGEFPYAYVRNDNTAIMANAHNKIGDAMFETGKGGVGGIDAWSGDVNLYPNTSVPIILRGGFYTVGTQSGLCAVNYAYGNPSTTISFRSSIVVLPQ